MKFYIAGKISGLDYEEAKQNFADAEYHLQMAGFVPVNPMKENGLDGDGNQYSWAEYMKRDIPLLLQCDGIYLLPNWVSSRGAKLERLIAQELDMEIMSGK